MLEGTMLRFNLRRALAATALTTTVGLLIATGQAFALSCELSGGSIPLGNVDTLGGGVTDVTATLELTCEDVVSETVMACMAIDPGQVPTNGTDQMVVHLFANEARTQPLDSQYRYPFHLTDEGEGIWQADFPVYVRVPASQTGLSTGLYSGHVMARSGVIETSIENCETTFDDVAEDHQMVIDGTVEANCSITAEPLAFGIVRQHEAKEATGGVAGMCTPGTEYSISLDNGQSPDSGIRNMVGSLGGFLTYELFQDSPRSLPWGEGGDALQDCTGIGVNEYQHPVYGYVPAQTANAGSYSDVVTATIVYSESECL